MAENKKRWRCYLSSIHDRGVRLFRGHVYGLFHPRVSARVHVSFNYHSVSWFIMILCDCLILEFSIMRYVAAPIENMSKLSKDSEQQMLDQSVNFIHSEYIKDLVNSSLN